MALVTKAAMLTAALFATQRNSYEEGTHPDSFLRLNSMLSILGRHVDYRPPEINQAILQIAREKTVFDYAMVGMEEPLWTAHSDQKAIDALRQAADLVTSQYKEVATEVDKYSYELSNVESYEKEEKVARIRFSFGRAQEIA